VFGEFVDLAKQMSGGVVAKCVDNYHLINCVNCALVMLFWRL